MYERFSFISAKIEISEYKWNWKSLKQLNSNEPYGTQQSLGPASWLSPSNSFIKEWRHCAKECNSEGDHSQFLTKTLKMILTLTITLKMTISMIIILIRAFSHFSAILARGARTWAKMALKINFFDPQQYICF
mgnify:CR=1 FL=1